MRKTALIFIGLICILGCQKKWPIPLVQKYQTQPGDLFYLRADNQFVLLSRGKALDIRVAPTGVQAYSYGDRITFSQKKKREAGEFWGASGQPAEMLESKEFAQVPGRADVVAFSPDGSLLAGGGPDGRIWIWSLSTQALLAELQDDMEIQALAFSPDSKTLASALGPHRIGTTLAINAPGVHLRNVSNGVVFDQFGAGPAQALAYAADGRLAAGFADGSILVRPAAGGTIFKLQGSTVSVTALAWHPTGQVLASGHTDKGVLFWNATTGKRLAGVSTDVPANPLFPKGTERIAISDDGTRLAAAFSDGDMRIWDTSAFNPPPKKH